MIRHLRDLMLLAIGLLSLNANPTQADHHQSTDHRDPPAAPAELVPIFQDVIDSGELSADATKILRYLSLSDRAHAEHPAIAPDEHLALHTELSELFEELLAEGDLTTDAADYLHHIIEHMATADEKIAAQQGEEALENSDDLRAIRQLVSAIAKVERTLKNDDSDEELLAQRNEMVAELVDRVIEWLDRIEAIDEQNAPQLLRLLAPSFGPPPAKQNHPNH